MPTHDMKPTEEEIAELSESNPQLLNALEGNSPVASAWLASWRAKRSIGEEAQEQASVIRQEVAVLGKQPEQGDLMQWCGFPTDMTRVSPFFPMGPREAKERPFLREFLITAANWGELRYTGPKLSIYEEDVLLALLALLGAVSVHREETTHDGRKTYTYRGPALPLLKILGYTRPGAKDYKRLIGALKLLTVAGVELRVAARSKSGKRKEPRYTSMAAMLSNVAWDEEQKELSATINPFFYETYFAGQVTLLDVRKRMAIAGNIAKGLYRFVQSHSSKSPLWTGHYLTLAQTLNMDVEQPQFKLRQLIKKAVTELVTQGILTKQSRMLKQDIVTLYRSDEALPAPGKRRKSLKK